MPRFELIDPRTEEWRSDQSRILGEVRAIRWNGNAPLRYNRPLCRTFRWWTP